MKNIWIKFWNWFNGYTETDSTLGDPTATDQHMYIFHHPPSKIKQIINILMKFWINHWQWIVGTLIALGVLFIMTLEYIYK